MRLADRYRVLRRVGEGGGGGVWLVEDRLAGNAVMVLKRLLSHAQSSLAQWLVNEFQILAQLDLPAVARVHDFGLADADAEDPGGAFFTREFVDGTPLDEALGDAPEGARVRALFQSAAETLRELHRLGVVHGDLKPANLIVPRDGDRVVLIDFGLAQGALGAAARVRGGTLGFMPPERQAMLLAGQSLPPDPRADVYALAVSLGCVLFGSAPGDDATPPPRVAADPSLRALWEIARRGAAADPAQRFATVDDLLVALSGPAESLRPRAPSGRVVFRPEGREAELGVILDAVSRRLIRRERDVPLVLLEGEEGSGRSTLLREVTWRAQLRGVQVLSIRCEAGEGPVRRLREGAEVLSGAPVDPAAPDALSAALRRASAVAPVLILADDLDEADDGVAAMLRSIAYGCEADEPLLVVASAANVSRVRELEATQRVVLGPLDEAAVAALCAQTLGVVEPGVAAAVLRRTGALPLAVTELLAALARDAAVSPSDVEATEVPGRARDIAARRAAALPRGARLTALAVAWLGAAATAERVRALVPEPDALERCRAGGLVAQRPDGSWSLRHGSLEEALLASCDDADRASLKRPVAEALDRADAPTTLRAEAWLRAGDPQRAMDLADDAVAALRRDGLPLTAVRLLAGIRAEAGASSARRYLEAELLMEGGRVAEAEALAASVGEDDPAVRRRARLLQARLLRSRGDIDGAGALLDAVAMEARVSDPDLAAEARVESGRVALARGDYATASARCDDAASLAVDPLARAKALSVAGMARVFEGRNAEGLAALEEARSTFASRSLPREEATLLTYLAVARERGGDLGGARELHEAALDRARAAGDLRAMVTARINLGNVTQRQGDLGAALEHTQAALQLSLRAGLRGHTATARMNLAIQLLRIGSIDRVRAELDAARAIALEAGHRDALAAATLLEGDALARRGDAEAGLARIAEAEAMFSDLGATEDLVDALLDGADVLLERGFDGDVDRAAERIARARAQLGDDASASPRVLALEGAVSLLRGDTRAAVRALGEAIGAAAAEHWEVHAQALALRARAHAAVGAELHARRDRERAVEILEEKAGLLPPDLRGAFWSVPRRSSLRGEVGVAQTHPSVELRAASPGGGLSVAAGRGLTNVNAQTLIASDERLVLLLEMSRRLGEEPSLERVLDLAVHSALELTHAERGAVLLPDGDGALRARVRLGPQRGDGPDEAFSQSIADSVWIDGEPVVTLNAQGDRRFEDFRSVHELGLCAVAAVPMRHRGRTLGVLYVESRRRRVAWAPSDVALMMAFSEQAAMAVEHRRLVEELEARSRELELARAEIEALLQTRERELEVTRSSLVRAQEALRVRFAPAGIVANTAAMQRVLALVERVRDADVPVVVEGESGTGKELISRALHFSGARAKGPFVVVHCGAIPETLLESELFGHVKGAFTGAERDRKGLIASAHRGTLFLDEVSEMSPRMQVELLRVLQDRKVRPVGGDQDESVDMRVVAASNRPSRRWSPKGNPRGPVLPPRRGDPHAPGAAGARRGHPRHRRAGALELLRRARRTAQAAHPGRAAPGDAAALAGQRAPAPPRPRERRGALRGRAHRRRRDPPPPEPARSPDRRALAPGRVPQRGEKGHRAPAHPRRPRTDQLEQGPRGRGAGDAPAHALPSAPRLRPAGLTTTLCRSVPPSRGPRTIASPAQVWGRDAARVLPRGSARAGFVIWDEAHHGTTHSDSGLDHAVAGRSLRDQHAPAPPE
ncbi:MAG: sigma 54-interacting transcriptional regulator [Polyangiales bacterium]